MRSTAGPEARTRPALHPIAAILGLAVLVASCAPHLSAPPAAPPKPAARAAQLPILPAPLVVPGNAAAALAAFRASCPALLKREDGSGLTRPADWAAPCAAAATATDEPTFFRDQFEGFIIGDAAAGFATGYFEPEIAGSRRRLPGYDTPLYRRPPDLVEADLGAFAADLKGRKLRGRVAGAALVPYPDRAAITAGALAGKGLELAWAADPYEAFFLEIQGSGRLRLPDGGIMRIGYDGQNGRDYVAIGRVLVQRGDLPKGGATMDTILAWLRSHPSDAPALLAANPSYVFFRELPAASADAGPIGALGVALTPRISVAADPAFVPLGAPLLVETTLPDKQPLRALMVAQDSGGAIKGANRIDLFRGAGATARAEAGAQAAPARVIVLLPRGWTPPAQARR